MRKSVVVSSDEIDVAVALARIAEERGLFRFWTTDNVNHDALIQAAVIAVSTERIGIGTGIAYSFTRTPLSAAIAAADIAAASKGRFTLGLGSGTRGLRARFGADFDHPGPRLAEYAQLVRQAWRGSPDGLAFSGRFYTANIPNWRPRASVQASEPEVYGSGLNPIMLTHAARSCDGIALHPLAVAEPYLAGTVLPAIEAGAGPNGPRPRLACWVLLAVAADRVAARNRVRKNIAFYLSTPSYRTVGEAMPWADNAARIREEFKKSATVEWPRLTGLVTEEMIDDLAIAGSVDEVAEHVARVEQRLGRHGVDELVYQVAGGDDPADAVAVFRQAIGAVTASHA